ERQSSGVPEKTILSGIPRTLPALLRAYELSMRAAHVGFDWAGPGDVLDKIDEEVAELRDAVTNQAIPPARAEEEMGDLLFSLVNLSRKLGIEPEAALRRANDKFQKRFDAMERAARERDRTLHTMSLEEMEQLWQEQK